MKTFSENEVATIVRKSVLETMNGVVDWIKEETVIVDTDTHIVVPNTEITMKQDSNTMFEYVAVRLKTAGITVTIFEE
jgi:hypothetical protein